MGGWPLLLLATILLCVIVESKGASNGKPFNKQLTGVKATTKRATSCSVRRRRRAAACSSRQFRCRNGQCIESESLCDGTKDCRDGSDETEAECNRPDSASCGPLTYRCKYGACVDGDSRCNGFNDCADGSDEAGCPKRETTSSTNTPPADCKSSQYRCNNGQCIDRTQLCDGRVHCYDRSDETTESCSNFECPGYSFRCRYGACIDQDLKCNNEVNCADGSDEDFELCGKPRPTRPTPSSNTGSNTSPHWNDNKPTSTSSPNNKESCRLPDQPENGEWKLDKSLCSDDKPCRPKSGVRQMDPGTQLVFSCHAGYKLNGTKDVFCGLQGSWSTIPKCVEIKCPALSSAAVEAKCTSGDSWVSCENSVPVKTRAEVSCRNSYVPDTADLTRRSTVQCNSKGEWEPNPIKCISVCGVPSNQVGTPLIVNGQSAQVAEFPWHATLYKNVNEEKKFICGATIIRENLLVTAAHCIFDEVNKRVDTPSKYYIAAGNVFKDYDFEGHDPLAVKKAQVKDIFVVCNYLGIEGNYASDIAILEIKQAFVFSSIIMPICLDVSAAGDQSALEAGNFGKVAGFGRTASGEASFILQTLSVPYVPLNTCKSSSIASGSVRYITSDKFCAGYTNGSSVCDGDSGGGLVFKTDNKWYLRGIVSVGIGSKKDGAVRTCDNFAYSLYTRVSSHMEWIQDIILRVDMNRPLKGCS